MVDQTFFDDMFKIWLLVQKDLSEVERWGPFRDRNKNLRSQSVLHHQYSICVILVPILLQLKNYYPRLDSELVKDAFTYHDIPECLLNRMQDVPSHEKNDEHDMIEYKAFIKLFLDGHKPSFDYLHRVYLLQFCSKSKELISQLPSNAQMIVRDLQMSHPYEVNLFPALEHYEYMYYAYEGFLNHKDEIILTNVLRSQFPRLVKHSQIIPGFKEVLFPQHFEDAARDFLEKHKHVPVFP